MLGSLTAHFRDFRTVDRVVAVARITLQNCLCRKGLRPHLSLRLRIAANNGGRLLLCILLRPCFAFCFACLARSAGRFRHGPGQCGSGRLKVLGWTTRHTIDLASAAQSAAGPFPV